MQFATYDDFARQVGQAVRGRSAGRPDSGEARCGAGAAARCGDRAARSGSNSSARSSRSCHRASIPFLVGGKTHEIFIVPIGQEQRGIRYEAIFV